MKILLHTVIIAVKYKVRCKLRIPIIIYFIQNCIEVLSNFPERENKILIFIELCLPSKKKVEDNLQATKIFRKCSYFSEYVSTLAHKHTLGK